jgi:hypothetical protein
LIVSIAWGFLLEKRPNAEGDAPDEKFWSVRGSTAHLLVLRGKPR